MLPALARTVSRALKDQGGSLSLSAPKSMFNVPITGARRFAAQSWPMERIRAVGKAGDATVNDVVLAMCSGALRNYMLSLDALPDAPLIAMVPVSLHGSDGGSSDGGGNAVGVVMCNLGTHLADAGDRLAAVHRSMEEGKAVLGTMSPLQIMAMSAIGVSPLAIWPLLRMTGTVRPPFNLVISNVPGPARADVLERRAARRAVPAVDPAGRAGAEHHLHELLERDRVRADRLPPHRAAPAAAAGLSRRRARGAREGRRGLRSGRRRGACWTLCSAQPG